MSLGLLQRRALFSPSLIDNQKFWDFIFKQPNYQDISLKLNKLAFKNSESNYFFSYTIPNINEVFDILIFETNITIDELKELIKEITYSPVQARYLLISFEKILNHESIEELFENSPDSDTHEDYFHTLINFRSKKIAGQNPYTNLLEMFLITSGILYILCASLQLTLIASTTLVFAGLGIILAGFLTPKALSYI
jgi:hypothetical protein